MLIRRRRIHIHTEESHRGGTHLRRERVLVETRHDHRFSPSGPFALLQSFWRHLPAWFRLAPLASRPVAESPKPLLVIPPSKTSKGDPQ